MAKNVFDPQKQYKVFLDGHAFDTVYDYPLLPGHFAADTVEVIETFNHEDHPTEYAVFTVDEPEKGSSKALPYPHSWVGTYRISMDLLRRKQPWLFQADPE